MSAKQTPNINFLGIDAGGTFTDFVLFNGQTWRIHKVLSTPENPAAAILQGIEELGLEKLLVTHQLVITHGSTIATNAALERKGARTIYITNTGFKDVLTIGRQARRELYNLNPPIIEPPVPEALCLEIDCRRDANNNVIKALEEAQLDQLEQQVEALQPEAIAINLLFSFLDERDERAIETRLAKYAFVSRSSFVLPVYKEYERGMATWLNASLGPKVEQYMLTLKNQLKSAAVSVMQSSGGTISIEQASKRAVNLLLSGPAGGLAAVKQISRHTGIDKILSFDMGGTSTDVSLMDGDFRLSEEGTINHWPVAVPMLDMETIGAGGGSIAWTDTAGLLHVGPHSAGAQPGPACYGLGGRMATVTDANAVLGRLQPEAFLGGSMSLDLDAAQKAMTKLGKSQHLDADAMAHGIIELAEQQMSAALHNISVKQGHNPAAFTLCCFGGAGGLHVCSLAERLGMRSALVPRNAGVFSALGMLCAEEKRSLSKSHICLLNDVTNAQLTTWFKELADQALSELTQPSDSIDNEQPMRIEKRLDLRYAGQSFSLDIAYGENLEDAFIQHHKDRYGHQLPLPVELVNVKVEVIGQAKIESLETINQTSPAKQAKPINNRLRRSGNEQIAVYNRDELAVNQCIRGPAIITETASTTWLKSGWRLQMDALGNLLLKKS